MTHSLKKNKNTLGKKFLIGGVGILLLLGSCFLVWENIKFFQKEKDLSIIINGYSDQINKLQNSNQDLKEKIGNYQDPNYIEKIAREEENMKKEGENVVSFVVPQGKEKLGDNVDSPNTFFGKIINTIKNYFQKSF